MESWHLKVFRRVFTYIYLFFIYMLICLNIYYFIIDRSSYIANIGNLYYFELSSAIITVLIYAISSSNINKSIVSLTVPCAIFVKIFYSLYASGLDSTLYTLKNYPGMISQLILIILFAFLGIGLSVWYATINTYQDNGKN